MRAVLPGRPESRLQTVATGFWNGRRIISYITGSAFAVLSDPTTLVQTVYTDHVDPLEAIAFDEAGGKLAACTYRVVHVYDPLSHPDGTVEWNLQASIPLDTETQHLKGRPDTAVSLSWGSSGELLVARSDLSLYQTSSSQATRCWQKRLPNPVKLAALSYDSAYIASVGTHDGLVKLWRRLSYGSDDVRFDFAYLAHPEPVTGLQWRKPHHVDETMDNVLYTFCADKVLRIWAQSDTHGQHHLQLWGTLDLMSSLEGPGRLPPGTPELTCAVLIHGRDFAAAAETAVQEGAGRGDASEVDLQNIITIANYNPDVCVVFDGRGRMSAWALDSVGCKTPKPSNIFSIVQAATSALDLTTRLDSGQPPHLEAYNYCNKPGGHMHFLLHHFDGHIDVYQSSIARLFSPDITAQLARMRLVSSWSGHSAAIRKTVRNFSGKAVVSRTAQDECAVWTHEWDGRDLDLSRQSAINEKDHIHRICVLRKGRFVVFLGHQAVSLWDCRTSTPNRLAREEYTVAGTPLCLLILPRSAPEDVCTAYIATVTSEKRGIVWEVKLPRYASDRPDAHTNGDVGGEHGTPHIREFFPFELGDAGDLAYALPVDPAGASPVISGFLDVFARDVAISYTHGGRVEFWTARVDQQHRRVEWLSTASMETAVVEPSLVSGSTMKTAALVSADRSGLTLWDVRGARLEYAGDFGGQGPIQDLDWTSTPDNQSILAVGFQHRLLLLAQMRFDYLNKGPAWASIHEINIGALTPHPIGDSTWLGDGHLVVAAGNQLFVYDRRFDVSSSLVASLRLPHGKEGKWDLFEVVQRLNGPLPVFHPQFLSQCVLAGKGVLVRKILQALNETLKFHVEGDVVDDYLGLDLDVFYMDGQRADTAGLGDTRTGAGYSSSRLGRRESYDSGEPFDEAMAESISNMLTRIALPQLSGHEQMQLLDIVECAGVVEKLRRSMDENAARFMVFFRQHALRKGRASEVNMSWREINWAFHSTSQDILVDFVARQHQGALQWENARETGMFMWLAENAVVKKQFELIARNQYARSDPKDPVGCSLFYLALKKKTVLQGLWRMANWSREQGATQKLLANNFDDPRWKTVALKNAYALMSKRRFEYAAAFFLLADHLQDAVNVCLGQLKDLPLAIAIARVYEGDQGPVLRRLLEDEVLAVAAREGNRWLASWAFWMLHRRDMAVRALIMPVYSLLETPSTMDIKSRLFLTDDPALVILYAQLRQKTLQTLRGASKVTPKAEWEFVLHSARLYDRMGCDLLGLDLVRNWEFLRGGIGALPGLGGEINPLQLLRRRSSLVVADLPMTTVTAKMQADLTSSGMQKAVPATVFTEPDTSSLLDSFGF